MIDWFALSHIWSILLDAMDDYRLCLELKDNPTIPIVS
jgi:hypothetical protein